MRTSLHPLIETHTGEDVEISFHVTDGAGNDVDLAAATASYKIARRAGDAALLTKTNGNGITLSDHTATIALNTAELTDGDAALLGDFFGQLTLTIGGVTLVAAEGPIAIDPVII